MLVSVTVLHHLLSLITRHVIPDPASAAHDSCTAQVAFIKRGSRSLAKALLR